MKTIEIFQQKCTSMLLPVLPYIIACTLFFGSTVVFSGIWFNYINSKTFIIAIGSACTIALVLFAVPWATLKNLLYTRMTWGIVAFLIVLVVAMLGSVDRVLSWLGHPERGTGTFFILLVALGAIAIGVALKDPKKIRRFLLYPITGAAVIVSLSVILGPSGFGIITSQVLENSSGGGLIGNSSFTGTYLAEALFIAIYLFATATTRTSRIVFGIVGATILVNPTLVNFAIFHGSITRVVDVLGNARADVIALIGGLLIVWGIIWSTSQRTIKKWSGRIILFCTIVGFLVSLILLVLPQTYIHQAFIQEATGSRFIYWDIALQGIQDHPVLGSGPETYRYTYEKYFNPDMMLAAYNKEQWSDKPHNAYMEWLSTTGIIGGIAYMFMLGCIAWGSFRVYRLTKHRWFFASINGFLFTALISNVFVFDTPTSYLLLFAVMAWVISSEGSLRSVNLGIETKPVTNINFISRAVCGVVLVVVTLVIMIPEMSKLKHAFVESQMPIEDRQLSYARVESISPFGSGIFIAERVDTYSQLYQAHIDEIVVLAEPQKDIIITDLDAMAKVLNDSFLIHPINTQATLALGRIASLKIAILNKLDSDALTEMQNAADKTIAISPTMPQGYWLLGQRYIYEGDYENALVSFQKGLAIDRLIPESHQIIINLAVLTKNETLLKEAQAQALADTGLLFNDNSVSK
ncbi:O-antigen ligase family protein [Candidatus Nomurabacteria bacterium]|nr:MAG: O-antigen ligase family protein [Candidatus Nomurabacteria bacterium]